MKKYSFRWQIVAIIVMVQTVTSAGSLHAQEIAKDSKDKYVIGFSSAITAADIEKTQVRIYRWAESPHGFAAEDAGATNDRLMGRKVTQTGPSNVPDGPDRVASGKPVQTKYCCSPKEIISASFNKNTGMYRYAGQKLEVPKDMYDEVVRLFRKKILEGKVEGVTDPAMAERIVKKGSLTYEQAWRMTEAGTYRSLKADVKTGAISCTLAAGLSFAIVFEDALRDGRSPEEALKLAAKSSGITFASTMTAHVLVKQLYRTSFLERTLNTVDDAASRVVQRLSRTETGRKIVSETAKALSGMEVGTRTACRTGAKILSSSAVTGTVTTAVVCTPEIVAGVRGRKGWVEVTENVTADILATTAGVAGTFAGAAAGTMMSPGVGTTVGAAAGGIACGAAVQMATRKAFDYVLDRVRR